MARNYTDDVAYFTAFCVEMYKNAHSMTGAEVIELFSDHGIMDYLADNYEVLHTQGPKWILAEIYNIIKEG